VATTNAVLVSTTTRRLLRISRNDVVRLFPIQQRRQEQQQNDLRRQLSTPQRRHEADQHPDQHQQQRRRDRDAPGQTPA